MAEIEISGYKVLIDDEDVEQVMRHKWFPHTKASPSSSRTYIIEYTGKAKGKRDTSLHRLVMGCEKGDGTVIDHINGNTLDNRKENLRRCKQAQNSRNRVKGKGTSQYKGVCWDKSKKAWEASIKYCYKLYHLGVYSSEVDAGRIYDIVALLFFKEFARTNFPKESYDELDLEAEYKKLLPTYHSKYRGVTLDSGKWSARVYRNHVLHPAGRFTNELEAARAYDRKAIELIGDKAKLNFPEEHKNILCHNKIGECNDK